MKSAAEPVGFAVFFGFIVLLSIFTQPVVPLNRAAVFVNVVLALTLILRRTLGLLAATVLSVNLLEELRMSPVAVLSFRVRLGALLFAVVLLRFGHHFPTV